MKTRFSRFFISPLFKGEAMDREVLSVDSEFNQVLQSDACRLEQLQCHTSASGHSFNRFFWGNKKSLVDDIEKGINLREQILKLYNENYHGGLMKLVVIGGESLDILEDWVLELFSHVKEGPQLKVVALYNAPIWQSGKLYKLEAVEEVHSLNLTWALSCLNNEYLKKPQDYLSHLLQHEGKGSVYFILKSKGWITSLSAGVAGDGMSRSRVAYIFSMCIHLTDSGLEKVYDVIGIVYQYIKLLQQTSPQNWIFKELQEIGNLMFKFAEEQPQDDYAAELADIQYEPWFGSRFNEEIIPDSLLKVWGDPPEINLSLHLPSKNVFIPNDFFIRNADSSQNQARSHHPFCLIDEPLIKLWYKLDDTFKVSRASTYFLVTLKGGVYNDIRSYLLADLFAVLLRDELNEMLYQAGITELGTTLAFTGDSLLLQLYGFNDKLIVLLSKILTIAKSFIPSADRFKVIKEEMERSLRNANLNPLSHSSYLRMQLLVEVFWDVDDQLLCLVDLSLADLEEFIPKLLVQLHIEGLCHGNLSEEEAINIADIFKCNLSTEPLPVNLRHKERVLCLPSGANLVKDVRVKNKFEENSVVQVYFQIEVDTGQEATKLGALADLFEDIVQEPLFDQLRTKEQLGYVVECSVRVTNRVLGFCFCVQSSKYNPVYLHGRIDNFINSVEKLLVCI
ncbi:hypothetical protein AQUCO_04900014v1 [Aquilegia coerulea]|uniref:Peptidase M16 C-terminal domain-containing protein n=1 Tax=Aquilegia coerulea TaxID=218851 RepID=A0A2G5CJH4_AQUCA|nr:hypothetical protein AQUCO_04900014v1 [Aquilegia coerulea]